MKSIILYSFIPYYFILYCTVLYHTVLCYSILYHIVLYFIVLYCTILYTGRPGDCPASRRRPPGLARRPPGPEAQGSLGGGHAPQRGVGGAIFCIACFSMVLLSPVGWCPPPSAHQIWFVLPMVLASQWAVALRRRLTGFCVPPAVLLVLLMILVFPSGYDHFWISCWFPYS